VRIVGILVAVLGAIGILAAIPVSGIVLFDGAVVAGAGEVGRQATKSGKPKAA